MDLPLTSFIGLSTIIPIVLGVVITIVALIWARRFMGKMMGADLKASGEPAQATIIRIWDTGSSINDNPVVGFLLEVRPQNQSPYQAETKSLIPRISVSQFQPGAIVPVKIDPQNKARVALDIFA